MARSTLTMLAGTAVIVLAMCGPVLPQSDRSYMPGLGDLMTMTVQPRHIKLGIAGQQRNWLYADYELHELQEAFDRIAAVWPEWQHFPVAQMSLVRVWRQVHAMGLPKGELSALGFAKLAVILPVLTASNWVFWRPFASRRSVETLRRVVPGGSASDDKKYFHVAFSLTKQQRLRLMKALGVPGRCSSQIRAAALMKLVSKAR